jgi:probable F420-dependent oxidoreductase
MKFSFPLPNMMHLAAITQPWELDLTGTDLQRIARVADELGFAAIQVSEHFAVPAEHLELTGAHWLDVPTAQSFLAASTTNLRVNSMLSLLPLKSPILTAKALATLDYLSGGRAMITFGIGWLPEEFEMLGAPPFSERGRVSDEYLEAIFELLHSDRPTFKGRYVAFENIGFEPKPVQKPHPPIWIGGDSDAALRRAARFADGWAPWQTRPEDLPARLDTLRSMTQWVDRPFDVYFSLASLSIGDDHVVQDDPLARAASSAQEVIDRCMQLAELGATETWVNPPPLAGLEAYLDHLRWVSEEIMPHCR